LLIGFGLAKYATNGTEITGQAFAAADHLQSRRVNRTPGIVVTD